MRTIDITKARGMLSKLFDKVYDKHERIIIKRHGRERVAIVPIEDVRQLKRMEDELIAAAEAALNETDERIPLDELAKELGL